jgi:hypothetical protein
MAPITDQDAADLKGLVARLEKRVQELEAKAGLSTPKTAAERMRMVLMGPPGAGKLLPTIVTSQIRDTDALALRQRHTSPSYQR